MIKLFVDRYHISTVFEHETFQEAAEDAIDQLNSDMSYPVKIMENDKVLWEDNGPFGEALVKLRSIVENLKKEKK